MLVLTRKPNESIVIGDNIEITVLEIKGEQVRIGISAPKEVGVYRKEIYQDIKKENQQASLANISALKLLGKIIKDE